MRPLSPYTLEPFQRFCDLANKDHLHHTDWKRFYEFVLACYRYQVDRTNEELQVIFKQAGFPAHSRQEMLDAYCHCRGILRVRGPVVTRRYA